MFSREKPYFPRKTPEGIMTISRVNKFSYLPYAMKMNVVFHISGVIFTNLTKALNLENFEKGKYDIVEREIHCC